MRTARPLLQVLAGEPPAFQKAFVDSLTKNNNEKNLRLRQFDVLVSQMFQNIVQIAIL